MVAAEMTTNEVVALGLYMVFVFGVVWLLSKP